MIKRQADRPPPVKRRAKPRKPKNAEEAALSKRTVTGREEYFRGGRNIRDAINYFATDNLRSDADKFVQEGKNPYDGMYHLIGNLIFFPKLHECAEAIKLSKGLLQSLRNDDVFAIGNIKDRKEMTKISKLEWISDWEFWPDNNNSARRWEPYTEIHNITIFSATLSDKQEASDREKPGPKPSRDWPILNFEFLKRIHRGNYPESVEDAIKWYEEAIRARGIHEYDRRTIKRHIANTFGNEFLDSIKHWF